MRKWRFIDSGGAPGLVNMDLDRSLFEGFIPGVSDPVLRFYEWDPPAVSVGRFQEPGDVVDLDECRRQGVDVVKRITGGGALFHGAGLTYSIVCSPGDAGEGGVREGYRRLTSFIISAYRKLGLEAGFAGDLFEINAARRSPVCSGSWEREDVIVRGMKIGGNAQRRSRGKVFQHGSVPVKPGPSEWARFFRAPADCSRSGWLGMFTDASPEKLKETLLESFSEDMGACF